MATFTKLSEGEIQEIAGRYELQILSYEAVEQGAGNTTYFLNTIHEKFILTIFEIDPTRATHISKVLLLLEKHEYPAPRLMKTVNGDVLTKHHEKAVLIKPYINGSVETKTGEKKAKEVGVALAKLHKIPAPDYLPNKHPYVEITYPRFMKQEVDRGYRNWVEQRYHAIVEKLPKELPVGLVHGDIFCDNLLFEDGKFKAIIDFEDVSRIYKVYDLGMAIVGLCAEDRGINLNKARALLEGYQEIRELEKMEKESLQLCIEWAAILTSTWRFWMYNIHQPDVERSEKYMQMVGIAKNTRLIPEKEFKKAVFS